MRRIPLSFPVALTVVLALSAQIANVPSNGLARTPPMGWSSRGFGAGIDDKTVREIADAIVAGGMKAVGYEYVIIDDGWQGKRGGDGKIEANANFPDMKALAGYVHSKGLKLGIYSSPGPRTCGGFEGSYGHEDQDARTFAEWDVDYLTYYACPAGQTTKDGDAPAAFRKMGEAIEKSGRRMVYDMGGAGIPNAGEWGAEAGGNLWRTAGDTRDTWPSMSADGFALSGMTKLTKPGWWPDPGPLQIGRGGMSVAEYRTQMTLWAMAAAPLIADNDPRKMSKDAAAMLTDKDVIAVDQDKLGRGADRISEKNETEVWARPLEHGEYAVALFNRGRTVAEISVKWPDLNLRDRMKVRDLWRHDNLGGVEYGFVVRVAPHDVVLIRVSK